MSDKLDELEATLREGMQLAKQPSLGRRAPAPAAVPHLSKARAGLRQFVKEHPDDARAYRLLSLAEETMLAYRPAMAALERAMALSGARDKKDAKRLAMLREASEEWAALPLTAEQLRELGEYLAGKLESEPVERSLRWTERWLHDHGFDDASVERVRSALDDRGAYSDMQVYYNVARG